MTDAIHFGPLSRIGGADCLDFVNTLHWRGTDHPIERLDEYEDLVAWAAYGDIVNAPQAARLRELAQQEPGEATRVLQHAWTFREALHRVFDAEMRRSEPPAYDLALLSDELAAALAQTTLTRGGDEYRLGWRDVDALLEAPLWQVA